MAKDKIVFLCNNCGMDYPKAYGKCPSCGAWNSFVEHRVPKQSPKDSAIGSIKGSFSEQLPKLIEEISLTDEIRIDTGSPEFNKILGGGLVSGSLVLIGGEPGIGKSTLALQIAFNIKNRKVLYISGEESLNQLKMRGERIRYASNNCYLLSEVSLERIFTQISNVNPEIIIIDSIQTISTDGIDSSAGSVTQVKECTSMLLKYAKQSNVPILLIGHITKDGSIAGPKILEHIVDVVLQFEGDMHHIYRILRSNKNRFGSTDEIAIFEMRQDGLREVTNPSELLLSQTANGLSGIAVSAMIEGIRPFLIEVQALVSSAAYGTPQRSATGFDTRRMNMLLAVLEKRAGFKLTQKDVFLNIAGGLKVNDTAIDLAVTAAVLSSNLDIAIDKTIAMAGEVGLSGEIRPVNRIESRILESEKLGFKKIIVPLYNYSQLPKKNFKIEILPVSKIEEAFKIIFR